ncbi:MAG: BCD family MFS transporter [Halieaceae bacterium]|jgi:BCD family chlorophyll transporter-like MFS transporter|nr:BCD family MFS transporter [Halieaceae bacterium]
MTNNGLSWPSIVRLGLVQTALGGVIVLTTSTLNRVMVVELALPAMLPGFLVALHHFVQMTRPHVGYGSDVGGRRTPFIIGGMALLATGGILAALGTAQMSNHVGGGVAMAFLAFLMIGFGAGAAGTSLLVLLAKRVSQQRRPAAATLVWIMMIAGFAVTAGTAGQFLDPYSPARLVMVTSAVSVFAFLLTVVAIYGIEAGSRDVQTAADAEAERQEKAGGMPAFRIAMREIWQEPQARQFTIFVFVSMLAYSAQDLILEPFAGTVFGMTPGESTGLAGIQHSGVLLGMLAVALSGSLLKMNTVTHLRRWTVGGCIASALALLGIALGGGIGTEWPLTANVFLLGIANGAFAVAAIASMMNLASDGKARREGLRMGLWGAAQAIAFAGGGFLGTVAIDITRSLIAEPAAAYAIVFSCEAAMFIWAAWLGSAVGNQRSELAPSFGDVAVASVLNNR